MSVMRSVVLGCGYHLPARIQQRRTEQSRWRPPTNGSCSAPAFENAHIAAAGELTSPTSRSTPPARRSPMPVSRWISVHHIVLATSTPDQTFPASAVTVQAGLGMTKGAAFDLQAVCSGFVYGRCRPTTAPLKAGSGLQARLSDWGGELLAHPRLERQDHLRTVRPWCRRLVLEAQLQPGHRS